MAQDVGTLNTEHVHHRHRQPGQARHGDRLPRHVGLPGAWQVMVRENPVNRRKAIYAGAHASHGIGWPTGPLSVTAERRGGFSTVQGAQMAMRRRVQHLFLEPAGGIGAYSNGIPG